MRPSFLEEGPPLSDTSAQMIIASLPLLAAHAPLMWRPPVLSVLSFALVLLAIALLPQLAPHQWERERWRALGMTVLAAPTVFWLGRVQPQMLGHALLEYLRFMALITALYVTAGGIALTLPPLHRTSRRVAALAVGACLASLIGTTGASMLLLRPFLKACPDSKQHAFRVVYFILIVSNVGGLLTPLGDPPLYLGFLGGVPFFWTLTLFWPWLVGLATLLLCFWLQDFWATRRDLLIGKPASSLTFKGTQNLLCLALVLFIVLAPSIVSLPTGVSEVLLALISIVSWLVTPRSLREEACFDWAPLREVGLLFAAIFLTMPPSLALLAYVAPSLPLNASPDFFWASGLVSSCLDNAPTYLTFVGAAAAKLHAGALTPGALLAAGRQGENYLTAISIGSVVMGGLTYIGNGPNLMVRAVAQAEGIATPSFLGYFVRAGLLLLPLLMFVATYFLDLA